MAESQHEQSHILQTEALCKSTETVKCLDLHIPRDGVSGMCFSRGKIAFFDPTFGVSMGAPFLDILALIYTQTYIEQKWKRKKPRGNNMNRPGLWLLYVIHGVHIGT